MTSKTSYLRTTVKFIVNIFHGWRRCWQTGFCAWWNIWSLSPSCYMFSPDKVYISLALLTQQPLDSAVVWEISTPCYAQLTLPFLRTTLLLYPAWVYNNLFPRQLTTPLQLNITPVCVGPAEAVTPLALQAGDSRPGKTCSASPCKTPEVTLAAWTFNSTHGCEMSRN